MAKRVGLWLIGARGGVGTMVAVGLSALEKGLTDNTGLISQLREFQHLDLVTWDQIVLGGNDIRTTCLVDEARSFATSSRAIDEQLVKSCADSLQTIDRRIRMGILHNSGETICRLADSSLATNQQSARSKIEKVKGDFKSFVDEHHLGTLVVVNLASTEPPIDLSTIPTSWRETNERLEQPENPLPASTLYAIATMELGYSFVNFTPSLGSNLPAMHELAVTSASAHAGQDGKTGETLIKSALAPVFANRNLKVMSWVGHNIFGNRDGQVLDDPVNKQSKVSSKDRLLGEILGYHPQTHVSIEYIQSLGDWKTAWDNVHFQGFLGTPMTLQFTWQGCDSMLAAPLVLDLFRFTERAMRAGQRGVLDFLACFFKTPMGSSENNFVKQFAMLTRWAEHLSQSDACESSIS